MTWQPGQLRAPLTPTLSPALSSALCVQLERAALLRVLRLLTVQLVSIPSLEPCIAQNVLPVITAATRHLLRRRVSLAILVMVVTTRAPSVQLTSSVLLALTSPLSVTIPPSRQSAPLSANRAQQVLSVPVVLLLHVPQDKSLLQMVVYVR